MHQTIVARLLIHLYLCTGGNIGAGCKGVREGCAYHQRVAAAPVKAPFIRKFNQIHQPPAIGQIEHLVPELKRLIGRQVRRLTHAFPQKRFHLLCGQFGGASAAIGIGGGVGAGVEGCAGGIRRHQMDMVGRNAQHFAYDLKYHRIGPGTDIRMPGEYAK